MSVTGPSMRIETERFIKKLGKSGNRLQIAAADALNDSAKEIEDTYQGRLIQRQKIRTKYTLNSVKTFKANPIRKGGEPRPLSRINAITGVRKMKGQDHYLLDLEQGGSKRGNRKTKNRVPIPLQTSRTGLSDMKPIAGGNRLTKGDTQMLKVDGKPFGGKGDRFVNQGQRFAILYKYKKKKTAGLTGDLSKPFFFSDNSGNVGIFKFLRNRARKIRNLEHSSIRNRRTDHFKKSVKLLAPVDVQRRFISNANKMIKDRI